MGGAARRDTYYDWQFAAELALRLAAFRCALATVVPGGVESARRALVEFVAFVSRTDEPVRKIGNGGARAWLWEVGLEASIILGADNRLGLAPLHDLGDERATVDDVLARALHALDAGDPTSAGAAARRLRELPVGADDVPFFRRFGPTVVADAVDAILLRDSQALHARLRDLLAWHDAASAPEPKVSKRARTPDPAVVSFTTLAFLALARRADMPILLGSAYAPECLLSATAPR